jgi:hypothetical protein
VVVSPAGDLEALVEVASFLLPFFQGPSSIDFCIADFSEAFFDISKNLG